MSAGFGRMAGMEALEWPEGWKTADSENLSAAVETALVAIRWAAEAGGSGMPPVVGYYRRAGNYAGALFTGIEPNDPFDLTAADLFATTTLSVDIGAHATRLLLDSGTTRLGVLELLRSLPVDARLETAGANVLTAAADLYQAFRGALGTNPWVTASKLAARKRPGLLPVRDSVVIDVLGLGPRNSSQRDWHLIRHLMLNDDVRASLRSLRGAAERAEDTHVERYDLRLLDVALWRWGVWRQRLR